MGPTKEVGCVICGEEPSKWTGSGDHRTTKVVLTKIFGYLLIPRSDAEVLYWICRDEGFCSRCFEVVEEIADFQSKIQALELALQYKAEVLGNVIATSRKFNEECYGVRAARSSCEKVKELWSKFRNPVLQNYKTGLLPNPNVPVLESQSSSSDHTAMASRLQKRRAASEGRSSKKQARRDVFFVENDDQDDAEDFHNDEHNASMGDFVDPDEGESEDCNYEPGGAIRQESEDNYESSDSEEEDTKGKGNNKLKKIKSSKPVYVPRGDDLKAVLPNGSDLITSYDCPKCTYNSYFGDISQCDSNRAAWRLLSKAKALLVRHYAKAHCPVRPQDMIVEGSEETTGNEYYICDLCNEKMIVQFSRDACPNNRRRLTHIRLARHYLNIHETVKEPPRPAWMKPDEVEAAAGGSLEGLVEGLHYFRCPKEMCSYFTKMSKSRDKRTGLPKLANHYLRMHEIKGWCKTEKEGKYPCLVKSNGDDQQFKCPRCQFLVKFTNQEKRSVKRKAFYDLLEHFSTHIYSPPKVKSAMKCTLCEEIVKFPTEWKPRSRFGDGEKKMKSLLIKHYKKVHRLDEIPQFDYYERVSDSQQQYQQLQPGMSTLSNNFGDEDVLSKAIASLQGEGNNTFMVSSGQGFLNAAPTI